MNALAVDFRRPTRNVRPLFDARGLSDEEHALATRCWKDRMVSEFASARVFGALVRQGMDARIDSAEVLRLTAMGTQEVEHAELCARVLRTLGEDPCADLPDDLPRVPDHEDAPPLEALLRNVISVSCCSETVAVALIGAEREVAMTPELAGLLERILADEVGHARFGWRLLESVASRLDAKLRERLSAHLVTVFEHQLAFHQPFLTLPPTSDRGIAVGAIDGRASFAMFEDTITTVIVPALEKSGLAARRAWRRALASAPR